MPISSIVNQFENSSPNPPKSESNISDIPPSSSSKPVISTSTTTQHSSNLIDHINYIETTTVSNYPSQAPDKSNNNLNKQESLSSIKSSTEYFPKIDIQSTTTTTERSIDPITSTSPKSNIILYEIPKTSSKNKQRNKSNSPIFVIDDYENQSTPSYTSTTQRKRTSTTTKRPQTTTKAIITSSRPKTKKVSTTTPKIIRTSQRATTTETFETYETTEKYNRQETIPTQRPSQSLLTQQSEFRKNQVRFSTPQPPTSTFSVEDDIAFLNSLVIIFF